MSEYTAEEVKAMSERMEDGTRIVPCESDCLRAAEALRAYAATLRQQATNSPEIGSKLVGCVTELAGYVDPEQVADMQKNGGGVSIGSFSERYGRTHPVYYLRAPSQQAERGDGAVSDEVVEIACKAASEVSADGIEAVAWPDEYDADELSTGRLFMRTALEAVAPLLRAPATPESKVYRCPRCATSMQVDPSAKPRAPAEQGGRADEAMVSVKQEDANNYCRILTALGMEEEGDPVAEVKRLAALAQNAQGHGDAVAFLVTDAKGKKHTIYNALLAEAIRKIAKDKGSSLQVDAVCTIPDYGWFCTRGEGHDGPCAAWPNSPTETCPTCGGPATRREVSGAFEMRNEWSHAECARVPDGMALVPRTPTIEMVAAGHDTYLGAPNMACFGLVWKAMLAAAPSAPEDADHGV